MYTCIYIYMNLPSTADGIYITSEATSWYPTQRQSDIYVQLTFFFMILQ